MTCPVCGNTVPPAKYAWNKKYCSKTCRLYAQSRRHSEKKKQRERGKTLLTGIEPKYEGSMLSDLTIVKVNGQDRIKAALTLEKLMRKTK